MAPQLTWSRASGRDELRVVGLAVTDLDRLRALPLDTLAHEVPVFASELLDDFDGTRTAPVLAHHLTPMSGEYRSDDAGIAFVPRHALLRGRSYSAVLGDTQLSVRLPRPDGGDAPTAVVGVHPSSGTVPRNLLRCYVEFSAPMSEGEAARCVSVVDDTGALLADALLTMDPELWDPHRRRITVLFDPARLKRGLAPHREAGYPLREGDDVWLVVDATMRDARGVPLGVDTRHRFAVGPDVRRRVDPSAWAVGNVEAGTHWPLRVSFDRALDHALLARCLTVVDADGSSVTGRSTTTDADTAWTFEPADPWAPVAHALVVDPILEDVCGNSVTRVFDRDLDSPAHARGPDRPVPLSILPR